MKIREAVIAIMEEARKTGQTPEEVLEKVIRGLDEEVGSSTPDKPVRHKVDW